MPLSLSSCNFLNSRCGACRKGEESACGRGMGPALGLWSPGTDPDLALSSSSESLGRSRLLPESGPTLPPVVCGKTHGGKRGPQC